MAAPAHAANDPIPIAPLLIEIEAVDALRLPRFAGSDIRGGLGKHLRQAVCSTGQPSCSGCLLQPSCLYPRVFETPVDAASSAVLRKYPSAPRPFALAPRPQQARTGPGGRLDLDLTLIGPAREALPHFLFSLDRLGGGGPAGRFRIVGARSHDGSPVFDGAARKILAPPAPWRLPASAPVSAMRIELMTPLRLRVDSRYTLEPSFPALTQALFRRLHLLRALYGDRPPCPDWSRPLLAAADAARTVRSSFHPFGSSRYSKGQDRTVPNGGVLGWLEVEGELGELAAWYRYAEPLQLGSGVTAGLGRYRIWTR